VRVYAKAKAGGPVSDVTVALRAFRSSNGAQLAGGPLLSSPQTVWRGERRWVTWLERTVSGTGFNFILPPAWTNSGSIDLVAELVPPQLFIGTGDAECETAGCLTNNKLTTTGVRFISTGYLRLATARLWHAGEDVSDFGALANPWSYPKPEVTFDKSAKLLPLQEGGLSYNHNSYYVSINVTDILNDSKQEAEEGETEEEKKERLNEEEDERRSEARDRLADYADDYPGCSWANFCADSVMGVYGPKISNGGTSNGKLTRWSPLCSVFGFGPESVTELRQSDTGCYSYTNEDHVAAVRRSPTSRSSRSIAATRSG
jgi:hypothetical protein